MSVSNAPTVLLALVGLGAGAATALGGAVRLGMLRTASLFAAFGSGAVIGVALFELLPEAIAAGRDRWPPLELTTATALGFVAYLAADRLIVGAQGQRGALRGHFAAASLTFHSLMDGLGVGFAFQLSLAAGAVVAAAVLAHDLVDGLNTVTVSLEGGTGPRAARLWLAADATAPLVGIGLTLLVSVPAPALAILLAAFAGFFLDIGASELLPRTVDRRRELPVVAATALGLAMICAVVRLAGA